METGVRKEVSKSAMTVDKVYTAEFQKEGTKTAQLRQTVVTKSHYPSKRVTNSLQDNPFSASEDFGFATEEFSNEETRVAWIDVPPAVSVDDVLGKLPEHATLYKVLANRPIVTDSQMYSIENPELDLTMDDIADRQIVRFSTGHEKAGQIVLDTNGKPQYRAVFYSNTAKEDIDQRTEKADDFFASDAIKAEMSGASMIVGQSI